MNKLEKQYNIENNEKDPNKAETKVIKIRDNVSLRLEDPNVLEKKISAMSEFKESNNSKENVEKFFQLYWGKNSVPEIGKESNDNQNESNAEKQAIVEKHKNFLEKKHNEIEEKIKKSSERFSLLSILAEEKFNKLNKLFPDIISNDFIDNLKIRSEIVKNALSILLMANNFSREKSRKLLSGNDFNSVPIELLRLISEKSVTLFSDQDKRYDNIDKKLTNAENLFVNKQDLNEEISKEEVIEEKRLLKGTIIGPESVGDSMNKNIGNREQNKENTDNDYENYIKEVVKKVQEIYIKAAEKYLPDGGSLKKQIIKFYSDPERLQKELSNVFRGVDVGEIDKRVKNVEESFKNRDVFMEQALSKDFTTSK